MGPHGSAYYRDYFIVTCPCSFVQSTLTVAFEYSRVKTVEFGAVSEHVPIGVPLRSVAQRHIIRKAMGHATVRSNRVWDRAMVAGGASVLLVGVENAVVPLCAGSDWWHHVFDGLPWASTAGAPGPSPPQPLQSKPHQRRVMRTAARVAQAQAS